MRLDLEEVSKRFEGKAALGSASLSLGDGERLALVGPSGSGKSTLLRIAALLETPDSGTVALDGEPVRGRPLHLARRVAMMHQKPVMLKRSVRENVAYGPRARGMPEDEVGQRVGRVLDDLEIRRLEDRYAPSLSGGEQQRVALGRVLAIRPELLVLDEFSANLDPANARLMQRVVTGFCASAGVTLLFATHNPQQARRLATRVALLLDSRLVECSPTAEFFSAPVEDGTRAFLAGEIPY